MFELRYVIVNNDRLSSFVPQTEVDGVDYSHLIAMAERNALQALAKDALATEKLKTLKATLKCVVVSTDEP